MLHMPEGTIGEHQSPMAMLWTWQVLLSGFCKAPGDAGARSLAVFKGSMCRAGQVQKMCSKQRARAKGYRHGWECMMEDLCIVEAVSNSTVHDAVQMSATAGARSRWAEARPGPWNGLPALLSWAGILGLAGAGLIAVALRSASATLAAAMTSPQPMGTPLYAKVTSNDWERG